MRRLEGLLDFMQISGEGIDSTVHRNTPLPFQALSFSEENSLRGLAGTIVS
jgi:hypothetical protein